MADERRFDDEEVAEILKRATTAEASGVPGPSAPATGLTLSQLQEIGAEVGIAPGQIAEAARSVSSRMPVPAPRMFLGAPRSVMRIVPIPRAMTDDEWNRLVVDLREAFVTPGQIQVHGQLRSWRNNNLQVHVEPDGERWRVRMQTLRGDTFPRAGTGAVAAVVSALVLLTSTTGLQPSDVVASTILGLFGLGQLVWARAVLPRWSSERMDQMEGLAERIVGRTRPLPE